jgi:hypothetical protein
VGLGGGPREWDDYEWVDLSTLRTRDEPRSPRAAPSVRTARTGQAARSTAAGSTGRRERARSRGGRVALAEPPVDAPSSAPEAPAGLPTAPPPDALSVALCALLTDAPLWLPVPGLRILLVDLDNLRAGPARWRARMAGVVTLARQADRAHFAGQAGPVERARPHLAEFAVAAVAVADGSDVADHVLLDAAAADVAAADGPEQVVVVSNDGIFAELAASGPLIVLSPGVDALSDRLDDAATDVLDLAALEADVTSNP